MSATTSTPPITISHTRDSFLELASPGGPSSPTPSSSSSSSSASALSPTLSDFALPPSDPWRTAAAETAAGIHYTLEAYPAPGQTNFGPPLRSAPLAVSAGARVVLLEDAAAVDGLALHVRARVVETGEVGTLPAWNLEGALERLARLNMEFNEAATCPAERRQLSRKGQSARDAFHSQDDSSPPSYSYLHAPLAHQHDRCVPFSTRTYGVRPNAAFDEDDDPFGLVDDGDGAVGAYGIRRKLGERRKSVVFVEVRPKVFRYPSQALVEAYFGEATEEEANIEGGEGEEGDRREGDEEWWWEGWEEQKDGSEDVFMDCE
ncbi:hypothetical protein DAEQUDRAFT_761852 [Daedalea quercina L-15889]|uniref:Uncharacterized protein n=1 Tax=Daedalea quercina L-15889 TaxID=1314783 RepID=A0A165TT46_9APHY|nr:hypothetical protein DAEQUDRAFT_761852 [Daedalea quercina L-15889]